MVLRHTAFNLAGLGIPLLVAVVSIPPLITALGTGRFGLLTLIWAVVSYFGILDLGLGRALTQRLAVVFAGDDHSSAGPLIATATVLLLALGVFASVVMTVAAPWGVSLIAGVPDAQETVAAVYAMAVAMPFIVLTSGFRGVLEARGAFGIVNLIRLPMGLFTFLGPLFVVLYFEPRLDWIAWVLVAGRIAGCVAHAWCAWRRLPPRMEFSVRTEAIKLLSISGAWLTVSNVISPFMGYADRFVIGALLSTSAVAYYATPNELVSKLWIVPGALTAVLFPNFAAHIARSNEQSWALLAKAVHWLFVALLPVMIGLSLFANDLMALWLGADFAAHSAPLLQVFAIGMLANCLATIPFTFIQSTGNARVTAWIHLAELPIYLAVLIVVIPVYGVMGAALAWLLRILVDTSLMFIWSFRLAKRSIVAVFNPSTAFLIFLSALSFYGALSPVGLLQTTWLLCVPAAIVFSFRLYFKAYSRPYRN